LRRATASCPRAAGAPVVEGLVPRPPQARSVVLCAGAPASSSATRRVDDLGFGTRTERDDVEVAFPARPRRGRRIHGVGDFGDLQKLCLEGVAS
jgi:hypothetical protein